MKLDFHAHQMCRFHNPYPTSKIHHLSCSEIPLRGPRIFIAKKKNNWQIYCNFQPAVTVSTWLVIFLPNIIGAPVVNAYNDIWRCLIVLHVENFTENGQEMVEDVICLADNLRSHKWMHLNHFPTISPKIFNGAHIQTHFSTMVCIYHSNTSDITGGNTQLSWTSVWRLDRSKLGRFTKLFLGHESPLSDDSKYT